MSDLRNTLEEERTEKSSSDGGVIEGSLRVEVEL
jgi:hypothetical protein